MENIDFKTLKALDDSFGSPFYIMDSSQYRQNINNFLNSFRRRYGKVISGYSFKTNYVPALCRVAKEEGCYAEVVSEMEYELAERIGFKKIIFNGPIKRSGILAKAIENGAIVNLDSVYEIDWICQYKKSHPDKNLKVGLRVNINLLDENGKSTIQCGLRFGRFGFPEDILAENIDRLKENDIRIVSIHGHTSSSDRAVVNYRVITNHLLAVCEKFQLNDLEYIDIGGGYFNTTPEGFDLTGRPTYQDYADCIIDEVENSAWFMKYKPFIVIEPGSSVTANVFTYYTKVYQTKKIGNVNFVIVDGTVFDVKPTLHQNNLPHDVFCGNGKDETCICDVVGSTCMEKDVLLKQVTLPNLSAGDFIRFKGVGAYTICMTPTFINYLAPILSFENDDIIEVRRRQTIDDILTIYK